MLPSLEEIFSDFQGDVDAYINNPSEFNMFDLLHRYCQYSYRYLINTSKCLAPNKEAKDHMIYMNSLIAEACNETDVPYFHPSGGYSVIDKGVKYVLDNGIQLSHKYISDIVTEFRDEKAKLEEDDILEEE